MNKAVFLDRDGVINRKAPEGQYVTRWEDLELLAGSAEAIAALNNEGFKVIVVTNQRGVAKGFLTVAELESMHERMCSDMATRGALITAVYYCPHETDPACGCRKPSPKMLFTAADQHEIDLNASWMVGDSDKDVEAGKRAGCRTIRIGQDSAAEPHEADLAAKSLLDASGLILREEGTLARRAEKGVGKLW